MKAKQKAKLFVASRQMDIDPVLGKLYGSFINYYSGEDKISKYRQDYHGNIFRPDMYDHYRMCVQCGEFIWRNRRIIGLCPICVISFPAFSLDISFGLSKSKKYKTALKYARAIQFYIKEEDRHVIRFNNLGEYASFRHAVDKLVSIIGDWKSTNMTLNGQLVSSDGLHSLGNELALICKLADAADVTFDGTTPIFTPKV